MGVMMLLPTFARGLLGGGGGHGMNEQFSEGVKRFSEVI